MKIVPLGGVTFDTGVIARPLVETVTVVLAMELPETFAAVRV